MDPIACVDLGTNTCLLLVARPAPDGGIAVLADRARIVRLGEGVDRTRMLSLDAQERTLTCLREYAAEARALGAVALHLVATSAMRDALNAAAFAQRITQETGFAVRIIHGDEEAALTYAATAVDFPLPSAPLAVFDVGGGSTETMVGQGSTLLTRSSIDVGSVRLTERFLRHDPPTAEEVAACEAHLVHALARCEDIPASAPLVGVAGTVTNLVACARGDAEYHPARMHGLPLHIDDVTRLKRQFAALSRKERLGVTPLDPGRADVILAGALIVEAVMVRHARQQIVASDRGVRFGLFHQLVPPQKAPGPASST